jgi:hypothetical protein
MIAPFSSSLKPNISTGERNTEATADNIPCPPVQTVDELRPSGDLPSKNDQNRTCDQRPGYHDGNGTAQHSCPWCGGSLRAEAREAANRMRQRMAESVSRYRAGDLTVTAGDMPDRPGEAKYSEQAARHQMGDPKEPFPAKTVASHHGDQRPVE